MFNSSCCVKSPTYHYLHSNRLLFGLIGSINNLDTITCPSVSSLGAIAMEFGMDIIVTYGTFSIIYILVTTDEVGDNWCGRFGLWPFRSVAVSVCGPSGLWPFRFVAVPVCGRFGLWPLWPVTSGLTVHQASMSDAKFRLCVVQGIFLRLKILNSIAYLVSLFSVLHADSENGTQHTPWPLTFFAK